MSRTKVSGFGFDATLLAMIMVSQWTGTDKRDKIWFDECLPSLIGEDTGGHSIRL